ncbi:MAG TPA: carbohydrate binding domain-containing protein, partial [Patescibacteria group bacterium]|nr:carbohydrate binding domain-containing protein [Patescibacteria group bacterium]
RARSGFGNHFKTEFTIRSNREDMNRKHPLKKQSAMVMLALTVFGAWNLVAQQNLLKNPGFEDNATGNSPSGWSTRADSAGTAILDEKEAHGGTHSIVIPANSAVEQRVENVPGGAYLARCWIKSEREQPVTVLLQDPDKPWSAYTCQETKVPAKQWVLLEAFCALDRPGNLSLTVGGTSKDFRLYHGNGGEMAAPVIADNFELVRYEPKAAERARVTVWDAKNSGTKPDWSGKKEWSAVEKSGQILAGTPIAQGGHLVGTLRREDGGLVIYTVQPDGLKPRCVIVPSPAITSPKCSMVQAGDRTGLRVAAENGASGFTAWFTTNGIVSVEPSQVASFKVQDCRLRYGLLPSFVGTDILYAPAKLQGSQFHIPSTQWLVGLGDGNDNMLVAVWETNAQAVALGITGEGQNRLITSLSIGTEKNGFSLSFVEHANIWHQQALNEDWLGEYTPIQWTRPFPARWMGQFMVTSGGRPNFRQPYMDYSFPVACAKTRMWGVWFEDWNHYPFFFDGSRTIVHFEKTFVPNGDALFYFLEPAAADLLSPVEIVEQVLGPDKTSVLFDFDANRLRKLKYSTPDEFMYDRPVCATTTRLSKIKREEKPTVGVNLATHLYEFIRGIRGRVDQYGTFFEHVSGYLQDQKSQHPDMTDFVAELQTMISEAKAKSKEVYATPLPAVERKIETMKNRIREGQTNGFDCAELDVRSPAGAQDDLCRRYNRLVMRLTQTAALKCGDSAEKAAVANYIWEQSRAILREPTRWEPRRTLYFFEP